MLEKIETKVESLKGLLSDAKKLNSAFAKHGFELSVKTVNLKPKKRKAKKVVEDAAPAPKKKAAKKKAATEDTEF